MIFVESCSLPPNMLKVSTKQNQDQDLLHFARAANMDALLGGNVTNSTHNATEMQLHG